jgi:hypothetical protein
MSTPPDLLQIDEITQKGIFIPPVLVIQIHIPSPSNVMHLKRDGPGICFVIYLTLSKVPPPCFLPLIADSLCVCLSLVLRAR